MSQFWFFIGLLFPVIRIPLFLSQFFPQIATNVDEEESGLHSLLLLANPLPLPLPPASLSLPGNKNNGCHQVALAQSDM